MIVSVTIMAIITAGVWRMVKGGTVYFLHAQREASAINSGERAMRGFLSGKGLLKDIRRCSAVTAIQANRLNLSCPGGTLAYFRQGNDLVQVVNGSTATVAKNVTGLNFRYYKIQNGLVSLTTAPALVSSIEISDMQVENSGVVYDLVSSARLRSK